MAIAESVRRYLQQNAVAFEVSSHPHSGSTHETAEAAHLSEDHLAKAVVLRDGHGYLMAVIPGGSWLETERLREELARPDLQLVPEAELADVFPDCEVGAVPPLPGAYGTEAVLDEELCALGEVTFEGGDHEQVVRTSGEAFQQLLKGVRRGHFSHAS
jgi:Ala-tRNA(Pro) deacylase